MSKPSGLWLALSLVAASVMVLVGGATAAGQDVYTVQSLVSDGPQVSAAGTDALLVNGWGLSAGPTTPWWVSNNHSNTSTLYSGVGGKVALTVAVPGGPTGTVFNPSTTAFAVSDGGKTGASRFLFATEAGKILGWSPSVNAAAALTGADRSAQSASYKGLAVLNDRLYATDFHNARVDVFDASFNLVSTPGAFADPQLPKGWAPFGIQALNGDVFVTYAQQDKARADEVAGPGLGYVDEFDPNGKLLARVAQKGNKRSPLNAPWGLALAPQSFGVFSGDLLVGNFGNGRISAYLEQTPGRWVYKGQLRTGAGAVITIDGLWAIAFGNGAAAGPATTLYFAAGPADEAHGLFGSITAG